MLRPVPPKAQLQLQVDLQTGRQPLPRETRLTMLPRLRCRLAAAAAAVSALGIPLTLRSVRPRLGAPLQQGAGPPPTRESPMSRPRWHRRAWRLRLRWPSSAHGRWRARSASKPGRASAHRSTASVAVESGLAAAATLSQSDGLQSRAKAWLIPLGPTHPRSGGRTDTLPSGRSLLAWHRLLWSQPRPVQRIDRSDGSLICGLYLEPCEARRPWVP